MQVTVIWVIIWLLTVSARKCFVPAKILDLIVEKIDSKTQMDFGKVSRSFSHEDITRRGIIRSLAKFLHEQPNGSNKVHLDSANLERYFQDINQLYRDYFGQKSHVWGVEVIIKTDFLPYVTLVDLDRTTKNLPCAHFDAEKMAESNQRVIDFTAQIISSINMGKYSQSRKLTGTVLHTIQDFYSHSNWVEMGHQNINTNIGSNKFSFLPTAKLSDTNACLNNCVLVNVPCSSIVKKLASLLAGLRVKTTLKCPLEYYKCDNNVAMLDKLLSGFFSGQKLADGTPVSNPGKMMKCNHGGLLDVDSIHIPALGGINKDAGMYLISPHAHLHLTAAYLAELHTEYFINSIRFQIGDEKFAKFLKIDKKFFK